jgi:hypothetical protein
VYSIPSVIGALKSVEGIVLENDNELGCPLADNSCLENPDDCEKGNNQSCKQSITVRKDYKKLVVLSFRFKISPDNRNGFIRKDDSSLALLIKHKHINKSLLTPIPR